MGMIGSACAALCGLALATAARADLVIMTSHGPAESTEATKVFNPKTGGWDVTLRALYNQWGDTVYEIRGSAAETVDNLVIDIDGPPAGSPILVRVLSEPYTLGIRSIHNIVQTGTGETLLSDIDVTQDIGAIQVQAIGLIFAGRDIVGPILATTPDNAIRGITAATAGRDLLGDVQAPNGRVGWLLAYRSVGAPGAPVHIEAKHAVWDVVGFDSVYANIVSGASGGPGKMWRVLTNHFQGSIDIVALRSEPNYGLTGRLQFFNTFQGSVSIGEGFTGAGQWIELPTNGLTGQLIFNSQNTPGGGWSAPVRIGPDGDPAQIVLTGPGYDTPAAALGGGSAGLVPFDLHRTSCLPAHASSVPLPPAGEDLVLQLRHYGPITWTGGAPVTIARRPTGTFGPFTPMPADQFVFSLDGADANTLLVQSAPGAGAFASDFEYQVLPTADLRCDVSGQPAVQWTGDYRLEILPAPCEGDLEGDGHVDVVDLLIMIARWGAATAGDPADINGDGVVGVLDLLSLLARWGPCP